MGGKGEATKGALRVIFVRWIVFEDRRANKAMAHFADKMVSLDSLETSYCGRNISC